MKNLDRFDIKIGDATVEVKLKNGIPPKHIILCSGDGFNHLLSGKITVSQLQKTNNLNVIDMSHYHKEI